MERVATAAKDYRAAVKEKRKQKFKIPLPELEKLKAIREEADAIKREKDLSDSLLTPDQKRVRDGYEMFKYHILENKKRKEMNLPNYQYIYPDTSNTEDCVPSFYIRLDKPERI